INTPVQGSFAHNFDLTTACGVAPKLMTMPEKDKEGIDLKSMADATHEVAHGGQKAAKAVVVLEEADLPYEEDILKNQYSLRTWQRYIEHKKKSKAPLKQICQVYERALKIFERSYKLWFNYLRFRKRMIAHKCPTDIAFQHLSDAYERCLVYLHKMPRIWLEYCEIMMKRGVITETRRVFDRSLRALPVTQHMRIWPLYIDFLTTHDITETTIRCYRRYLKLNPLAREDFVEYLRKVDQLDEAAKQLANLVNEDRPVSEKGKTVHQLWSELAELISQNPTKVTSLNVDAILREGIKRYSDQVGVLWCSLAEYYIRSAQFEKARDIYEEAMGSTKTVRDFTQIFDAYAKLEEREAAARVEQLDEENATDEDDLELEWLFARYEHLLERRPLLLNSVLLRQNPHNVHEWLNRVELYEGHPNKMIETYLEAVKTINPKMQVGRLSALWISFAKFYEKNKQVQDARSIFERAVEAPYVKVDELATVWCEYAEMEMRQRANDRAVSVLKRAVAPPPRKTGYFDEGETVQTRVHKSLKVWSMYADIEECFGTVEKCRAVYDRVIDLRIATPQIVINYASFLEEHNYFEDAFKAYERGIALFKWPNVYDIWNLYLTKFIKRYGGSKLERARDLFEQCLDGCPAKFAKNIFLLYAQLEEKHGLARHAMAIYNRATKAVDREDQYAMYNIYIKRAGEDFGLPHTRPIYEDAISNLPENKSRDMSMRYSAMERALGEIDRARAIYAHASEICDPRVYGIFWETWKEFELKHGNEDTVREMLRIKRSVQATYNTNINYMSAQMIAAGNPQMPGEGTTGGDSMALLEARAQAVVEEKKASATGGNISFVRGASKTTKESRTENPDEIDIGDDNEEEGDDTGEEMGGGEVSTRAVPAAVLGGLAPKEE
ncbi:hypothetical protein PENTCL1PPCAC_26525, partial [Pristionchus entomophagus]